MRKTIYLLLSVLLIFVVASSFAATKTFYVQETEFIKIIPTAIDEDGDSITYTFSNPLDNQGEWQTTLEDQGEYLVTITASDGLLNTSEQIKIIVENKNQEPTLSENKLVVKESELINLKEVITDPDDDVLIYLFEEPFDQDGLWQTQFDDAGGHVTTVTIDDGEYTLQRRIQITVLDSNQPPQITSIFSPKNSITVKEGEQYNLFVNASDIDEQPLAYNWLLNNLSISEDEQTTLYFDFTSQGEHTLELQITDGIATASRIWTFTVENTNRQPELSHLPVSANEGDLVELDLPTTDIDDDQLTYLFEHPLDENGAWQTSFEDAGRYILNITASDGDLQTTVQVDITITDVDRAPTILSPTTLIVEEESTLEHTFEATDPDGDKIKITVDNLPQDATLKQGILKYTPSFDTIQRKSSRLNNFLNRVRIEQIFLKKRTIPITVNACGKQWCEKKQVDIVVLNKNREPQFPDFQPVTVTETEHLQVTPQATDPDGDIVQYTFSKPLSKYKGVWQTSFEDQGNYTVYVTATDGQHHVTRPLHVTVLKNNRAPTLQIDPDHLTVNEGQEFTLPIEATDPDNDPLEIGLKNPPSNSSFAQQRFSWQPPFNTVINKTDSWFNNLVSNIPYLNKKLSSEKATLWLEFAASDEEVEVNHPVSLTIKNVNRAPSISIISPQQSITVPTQIPILFAINTTDSDGDQLEITWQFGAISERIHDTTQIERIFTTPGEKQVTVKVSDGRDQVHHTWKISAKQGILAPQPQVVQPVAQPQQHTYYSNSIEYQNSPVSVAVRQPQEEPVEQPTSQDSNDYLYKRIEYISDLDKQRLEQQS